MGLNTIEVDKQTREIIKELKRLENGFDAEERKEIMKDGAQMLIIAARQKVPVSKEPHQRYLSNGSSITYYTENLKKSIQELKFEKSSDLFVGPKLASKRSRAKSYGKSENNVDGYYAHFVEFGNTNYAAKPYMRPAVTEMFAAIVASFARNAKKRLNKLLK